MGEKFEGVWSRSGRRVRVERTWRGHRFTDEELKLLLAGAVIEFESVSTVGRTYPLKVRLTDIPIDGTNRTFVGYEIADWPDRHSGVWSETGKEVHFNRKWKDRLFSDEECERLLAGQAIELGQEERNGYLFNVKGALEVQHRGETGRPYVGIKPEWVSTGIPVNDD